MLGHRAADCSSLTHNSLYSLVLQGALRWLPRQPCPSWLLVSIPHSEACQRSRLYLPHITTTCASLILQSPRVQRLLLLIYTHFSHNNLQIQTPRENFPAGLFSLMSFPPLLSRARKPASWEGRYQTERIDYLFIVMNSTVDLLYPTE